ncbi:MAG: restriction endonuclease subunit S [Rhizobiaceae bacterium]|nr:restriction endonuclease subunit S [Bacillus sp. PR5]MCO5081831.1 restriction endonuclease subunit S [Rhizobiaceae bacterium]
MMNLPNSWAQVPLEELFQIVLGGDWGSDPSDALDDSSLVRCIRASELRDWGTQKGKTAAIRRLKNSSIEKRRLRTGDILVEVSGGGPDQAVGRTVLITNEVLSADQNCDFVCTNFFRFCRPNKNINTSYLNWYLQHFYSVGGTETLQGGSNNLRNLRFPDYIAQQIPIAPLNEQYRIVRKIEELLSELDKGVENLITAYEQLKAYRQSVLKAAFEGKLTANRRDGELQRSNKSSCAALTESLPNEWQLTPVSALLSEPLCNGRSVKDRPGGFPVLRLTALKQGRIDLTEFKEGDWECSDAAPFLVSKGDFFLSRGNGSKQLVGAGGLVREVPRQVAFPDTMIRIRLDTKLVNPRYFSLCWNSRIVRQQIERDARTTAGIYKINQSHVSSFEVPVPPLKEQEKIVSLVEEKLSTTDFAIQQVIDQLRRTDLLKNSILQKAFSGQLVDQDAGDEPASALLDRIRAERQEGGGAKRRNKKNGKKEAA